MRLQMTNHMVHIVDMLGIINFRLMVYHCAPTCEFYEDKKFGNELNEIVKTLLKYEWRFDADYSLVLLNDIYQLGIYLKNHIAETDEYYGINSKLLMQLGDKIINELKELVC